MNTNPAPDQALFCSISAGRCWEGLALYFGSWQGAGIADGPRLDPNHPRGAGDGFAGDSAGVWPRASLRGWLKRSVARAVFSSLQPSRRSGVAV